MPRMLEIVTKAGDGVFAVRQMTGPEALGRSYEHHVDRLSERRDIVPGRLSMAPR